ncbi:xylose repressor [Actinoplanes lobatus]|uniref:Putative NBD/HSP70 family sugar kinase n=1 Tax=Actinoplanes lobatus TaxID=113568 RepID=A0A7W7HJW9_9ACTN|nr:ROK family transcriptional regulator [Actinoplanes lobatus]MBB4751855.1 putative NBD/HSP70 family sugar kinase [Actinoplanes lobatus]GGN97345.1 xylose repressor [Actinoplanes lobatus]GIE45668.1 xylose repressor [Actinoplanes lobatus]
MPDPMPAPPTVTGRASTARLARWQGAVEVLAHLRGTPGVTRAALARDLGLGSGTATELLGRLRDAHLLAEQPAPATGRGRPTTILRAHPAGPLVLVIDVRHEEWRIAVAALDGTLTDDTRMRHAARDPRRVRDALTEAVRTTVRRLPGRIRAVSLAIAGTVQEQRLVQASAMGWGPIDLAPIVAGTGLPLIAGNDATLAGVAEARTGAAHGHRAALHLLIEVGIGGVTVVDGRPITGALGAGGEFGHLPFGDPTRPCPCGAYGCWDLEIDGRALARHLGAPPPADPRSYARDLLTEVERTAGQSSPAATALHTVAAAFGRGVAGLVNAHDPDVVTIGGLAIRLRQAAPEAFARAYHAGLMTFRRDRPPPVRDAQHGDDGALHGAAMLGLDAITNVEALADWHRRR